MDRFEYTVKCRDEECNVRLNPGVRYCEAHDWLIEKWLKKSREMLARIQEKSKCEK